MAKVAPQTAQVMAEHWSQRAHRFDGAASHLRDFDLWLNVFRDALGTTPRDVVDLGSGTGACALICATLGHRVTAVDGSNGMLDFARDQAQARSLDIIFIEKNMDDAQLPDGCADIVTIRNVLWTLEKPVEALKLGFRLLRPGGVLLVADGLWRSGPNRSAEEFGAILPFVNGLSELDARVMLRQAGFAEVKAWQDQLPADLYGHMYDAGTPALIRFFLLTAVKRGG